MCYIDAGGEDVAYTFPRRLNLFGCQFAKKEKWVGRLWGDVASPAREVALQPQGCSAIFLLLTTRQSKYP